MFQKIILLITILSPLVVRATDLHVDFNTLVAGKPAYKLPEPGIITFYGGAALLPQKFDLSKGIKIKFEFRADKVQSNPYARLMEGKGFLIHFINRKGSKVKLLVQPPGEKKYQQTVAPVTPSAEKWHLLVATLEPANNFISLQVDNGEKSTLPWNFKTQNIRDVKIFLGGTQMENCKRAFSGSIRNLTISIPWKSLEIAEKRSEKKLTVNGKPIVYHRVCQNNNRHYAFPGITQLQDKSLAVVFREGDSHVDPFGRICISRSYDNGKNWTAPLVIFDTASDDRDPSIQLLSDGRVLLTCFSNCCWTMKSHEKQYGSYIKAFKQSGEIADASYYLFSSDGGKNWEPPINMATFTPHGPVFYQNHFFHPKVACLKQVEIRKISDDGQKNISLGKIKAPKDLPGKLFVEPHLAILPNGTMLCVIRVDFDGYVRLSRS
jgi:hypothetical protein